MPCRRAQALASGGPNQGPLTGWLRPHDPSNEGPSNLGRHGTPAESPRRGHHLRLGTVSCYRAPRQREIPLQLGGTSLAEGAIAVRSALLTALQRRTDLSTVMTADLSGGLDSSTLALLAAAHLPAGLSVITYADAVAGSTDDLAYAELCTQAETRLCQIVVNGDENTLPFLDLDQAPLLDEPSQDTLLWVRTQARLAPAIAHASQLHLSGDGGDVVLTGTPTYLADLARTGRVRDLPREATAWARLRHRPAHTVRVHDPLPDMRPCYVDDLEGSWVEFLDEWPGINKYCEEAVDIWQIRG
jgi:asparagine synthetase B (glutamine-hydrolysing)